MASTEQVALPHLGENEGATQTSGHEAFDIVLDHILVWLQDVGQIFKCQVTADFLHTCRGGFSMCVAGKGSWNASVHTAHAFRP